LDLVCNASAAALFNTISRGRCAAATVCAAPYVLKAKLRVQGLAPETPDRLAIVGFAPETSAEL
jgi:hypothetical protein